MISASEPLEFVPHGRTVLARHPTQIYNKNSNGSVSEHSLLYKLTNFAIKDESLLEAKENEAEWWCVREVFYRSGDDFEEDSPESLKETKGEFMSESFRPPSRLKPDFNISVKSELMGGVKKMDTDCATSAGTSRGGSANSSSNMSKKFNLSNGQSGRINKRPLNPKTDSVYEEELYVKGCTAVWSKGLISTPATKLSGPEHRETICCYTVENPIKHATFANFHVTINNTMLIDALNSQIGDVKKNIKIEDTTEHLETKIMPSILLIDSKCMKVFATDGREYMASIPFQVKKVWPMKYGVLLEKDATPLLHNSFLPGSFMKFNESHNSTFAKSKSYPFNMSAKLRQESVSGYDQDIPLPTCFSLSHPLDEVTPVLMKSPAQGLQYFNDGDIQIIFVNTEPSIILLYDWKLGTHSLWKIRKALRDECLSICPNMNSTTTVFSQSCDFISSPVHSNVGKNTTNWMTGVGSPIHSKKFGTPTMNRSRLNSPMASVFHQQGMSPHGSIGQASSASMLANTLGQTPPSLPLYPDICLDHIWTDNQTIRRDPIENPYELKTFLHTDLVNHDYLCFMVKVSGVSRLQILRLKKSYTNRQSTKTHLIVGSVSTVQAKDAVVLDHLKMIALIDESGNIILLSGSNTVGKVHVGGVLARLIDSPYVSKGEGLQSPFPRRSSLLPSRLHDATFDDSALHLLSPVPAARPHAHTHAQHQPRLKWLCDAVGSRVTLIFDGGAMYRISLPTVTCSALVTTCCDALRAVLPDDIAMQVVIKWYGVRNAPGTQDLAPEHEWRMFAELLYSLAGYDTERLAHTRHPDDQIEYVEVATKKQRTSSDGTHEDWEYLLNSKLHKTIGSSLAGQLHLHPVPSTEGPPRTHSKNTQLNQNQFNTNSLLFPYLIQILYAFHLVYEDIKLNTLLGSNLKPLSEFLYQISKDLKLDSYVNHYWLDFPMNIELEYDKNDSQLCPQVLKKLSEPSYFRSEPPSIFAYVDAMLQDIDVGYYPYLSDVNNMSKDIIEILSTSGCGRGCGLQTIAGAEHLAASTPRRGEQPDPAPPHHRALRAAAERGINLRDVDNLPPGVALLLLSIFSRCKSAPGADWGAEAYKLALRGDLARQAEIAATLTNTTHYMETLALEVLEKETAFSVSEPLQTKKEDSDNLTGMEHLNTKLLNLLYPRDRRMTEVISLLQSSIPVSINLTQRPEVSDHDFIEEQEKHLQALNTRTMALPLARGMLTLRSLPCAPTEPLALPKLCVSGRGPPPRCNAITLTGDTPPNQLVWPTFHNGVAAGLALVPMTGSSIHSSWVLYNKPRGAAEMSCEHAGFLMALGLNGHLRDMPFMHIYEYLVKCNELTSVGLLLGLAATYRGTMDVQATKMMSIHLEPLLPPTSIELDIQQNILVAALLGVGLLYENTHHSHYARVLLDEIGKPPGPEMENCVEREGYALAAGLALGMVMLGGHAAAPAALASLAPRLRTYMLGGGKAALTGAQKDKYKQSSYAVREGATVNLDVTSPGATVALGVIYLRSNNAAVASWLQPPRTHYQLDFVRPDLLMLRVIARGLVLWDSIEPSEEWIESQVPDTIRPYCFVKPTEDNIDYEAMNQAYCNIVAGACFALGLRYAGSGCEEARDAALHYTRQLIAAQGKSVAELATRSTLEACLCVCLLAAGMIMAGRGDIGVLRVCRRLRARVASTAPAHALTHGGQMAVHCTIGLLFLGGGRLTLGAAPRHVVAMLAAFFPKFPTHSEDNRYHLQAFRHLYVLAVEPRLILPRDLDTGKLCYAHIQVVDLSGAVKSMRAPCIVPALDTLSELRVEDPRYWPIVFRRDSNWDQLQTFLSYTWCVDIAQRCGCLAYTADPLGFRTLLARTLTLDRASTWTWDPDTIQLFCADDTIRNFVKHYLTKDQGNGICADCLPVGTRRRGSPPAPPARCSCRRHGDPERAHEQALTMCVCECLLRDILCVLPVWTTFLKIIKSMSTDPSSYHIWQIKLLLSHIDNHNRRVHTEMTVDSQEPAEPLISTEHAIAIKQKVAAIFDEAEPKISPYLRKYLGRPSSRKISQCDENLKMLTAFIVYHDLPRKVIDFHSDAELSLVLGVEGGLRAGAAGRVWALAR